MSPPTRSPAQTWDTDLYDAAHAFVYRAASGLVEMLAPRPGERVIDLGCGTGHLAGQIAAAGADVVGIDASAEMVAAAGRQFPHLRFEVGDARVFVTDPVVDAVFSNATLHWVTPPAAAVDRVWHALRPGGRFVAEFGGAGNVAGILAACAAALTAFGVATTDDAPVNPWYFPTVGQYATLLEARGFEVSLATLFDRPTPLDGEDGFRNWLHMFGGPILARVPRAQTEAFLTAAETAAQPALYHDGRWVADYRRLRVVARRPDR